MPEWCLTYQGCRAPHKQINHHLWCAATSAVLPITEVVAVLNHETAAKLRQIKLADMVEAYEQQRSISSLQTLTLNERLGLMVDQEWIRRQNNKMTALVKKAGFIESIACIEDVDYTADRKLDRQLVLSWPREITSTMLEILSLREQRALGKAFWPRLSEQPLVGKNWRPAIFGRMTLSKSSQVNLSVFSERVVPGRWPLLPLKPLEHL
jgi:hypothetical protein